MRFLLACSYLLCFSVPEAQQFPGIKTTSFKTDSFNILNYGAKADGISLNTKAIDDAVHACYKNGGGVVVVPAGLWFTGPIVLLSNVNLCVQRGAMVFTDDTDPVVDIANSSLIRFDKFTTVAIPTMIIRMGGKRTNIIDWINNAPLKSGQSLIVSGAAENSLQIK